MFLKKIDIYGSNLDFTINKRSKFTTNLGGIFTLFSVCAYIILFNLLAKDLYYRVNPKVNQENVYVTDNFINNFTIREDTFLFAIYDYSITEDPKLYKYTAMYKEINENETLKISLDLMKCNKAKYANLFHDKKNGADLYCLNLTKIINKNLTNFFYSDNVFSSVIEFHIDFDFDYYNSLNSTEKNKIHKRIDTIGYFWPDLSFSPNNFTNPLNIQLNYNKFYLNQDTVYRNNIRFVETIIEEDINFFTDEIQKKASSIHAGFQFANYPSRKDDTSELAKFLLHLDGLYSRKYTRIYKKIPEILAEVSGTMDVIILAFTYIVGYFTTHKLDYALVNKFVAYFSKDKNKDDNLVWKYQNHKEFYDVFKNKKPLKIENKESDMFKKSPNLDMNDINNKKFEKDSNFNKENEEMKAKNNPEIETQKKYLCDEVNIIQNQNNNNRIYDVNVEMIAIDIKDNILDDNQLEKNKNISEKEFNEGSKFIKNPGLTNNDIINNKIMNDTTESFDYSKKNKNDFPYTGFFSYYFPICFSKKNVKSKKKLNYSKILQYFSGKLQNHLDFFHYLEYVSTTTLLKNTSIKKDREKIKFKYLSKHLYYMRDCDEESILKNMKKKEKKNK